jgi:type I restriction enzyme R subunit
MTTSANFGFLKGHDPNLVTFGGLAERYFREDPPTSLMKLRQFAELLSKLVAAYHAVYLGERETFEDTLRRLSLDRGCRPSRCFSADKSFDEKGRHCAS